MLNKTHMDSWANEQIHQKEKDIFSSLLSFLPGLHSERTEIFPQSNTLVWLLCNSWIGLMWCSLTNHDLLQELQFADIVWNWLCCSISKHIHVVGVQFHIYVSGDCTIIFVVQVHSSGTRWIVFSSLKKRIQAKLNTHFHRFSADSMCFLSLIEKNDLHPFAIKVSVQLRVWSFLGFLAIQSIILIILHW